MVETLCLDPFLLQKLFSPPAWLGVVFGSLDLRVNALQLDLQMQSSAPDEVRFTASSLALHLRHADLTATGG